MILQGVADRRQAEQDERIALAWHIEALSRRPKLPRLETLLQKPKAKRKEAMSADQIEASMRAWLGGRKGRAARAGASPTAG